MAPLATRVGVSLGDADRPSHVAVVREPTTGATLRTKGRLYVLVEVGGQGSALRAVASEAAELLRDEYYYDQSAGIEVSLRRAILQANKRARLGLRAGDTLHLACVVLCGNETYAARVGAAEVFVVRRARLFVPGSAPGELADYAYRGPRTTSPHLGADSELPVSAWHGQAEPGDTLILAGARLIDALGVEEVKQAAITLHPSAAAWQLQELFVAQAGRGAAGLVIVEVAPLATAARVRGETPPRSEPEAEEIAERIRGRFEALASARRRAALGVAALMAGLARPLVSVLAVAAALLPRRRAPLPRPTEVAAFRAQRRRRVAVALASALVLASSGVLALAYVDYEDARANVNGALALAGAQREIQAARAAAERRPPDVTAARMRLERAEALLGEAATSKRADPARIAALRGQITELRERLTSVLVDLAKSDPKSAPRSLDYAPSGAIYLADPGAGKVWRVLADGTTTVLAQAGDLGIGAPALVATSGEAVYVLDGAGRLFRYEGATARREVSIRDRKFSAPVDFALFSGNLYVLDRAGQIWKYEPSAEGGYNAPAIAFLAQPLAPGTARSLAVDGDVWVSTDDGQLFRYRRGGGVTAAQLEFVVRWAGEPARVSAVQAREEQHAIYLLDARSRRVVQLARDGREVARVVLPTELPEPSAFVVVEEGAYVVSLHGARLARTDLAR